MSDTHTLHVDRCTLCVCVCPAPFGYPSGTLRVRFFVLSLIPLRAWGGSRRRGRDFPDRDEASEEVRRVCREHVRAEPAKVPRVGAYLE